MRAEVRWYRRLRPGSCRRTLRTVADSSASRRFASRRASLSEPFLSLSGSWSLALCGSLGWPVGFFRNLSLIFWPAALTLSLTFFPAAFALSLIFSPAALSLSLPFLAAAFSLSVSFFARALTLAQTFLARPTILSITQSIALFTGRASFWK